MKSAFTFLLALFVLAGMAQKKNPSDAHIIGDVQAAGEHIPFANVAVKGTTIGTATDATGHYQLLNLTPGTYTLQVKMVGYKPQEQTVEVKQGLTSELKFHLELDLLGLDEVVVTADRNERNRRNSSTVVNTLSPKLFESIQSNTLADGLNFCSGLRTENNCANCGFNQVRINGMEGPYSQILINSRPIFSGLAGVYGLELIPPAMLERVEVIRGGGSALYGSNAVAGTINLILRDPIHNGYTFATTSSLVGVGTDGQVAPDQNLSFNASVVSPDNKTGLALYGYMRDKKPFDANNDSFSDLTSLSNATLGGRGFVRLGNRAKLALDFFHINEKRRGGDLFDRPEHEANIAESVRHRISTGAITFEQFVRTQDVWSVYASAQNVGRDSYYGALQSLKDYGHTDDLTFVTGTQYTLNQERWNLLLGVENRFSRLFDQKLGYADYENAVIEDGAIVSVPHTDNTTVSDQDQNNLGAFVQGELNWRKWVLSAGGRVDRYSIIDHQTQTMAKAGTVFSPRATAKYNAFSFAQLRLSYAKGFRTPQIFDEDLHILTSGSRKVLHRNAPNLKPEDSHSLMASVDLNGTIGTQALSLLVEGFYTRLDNAFVLEYGEANQDNTVVYTRSNAPFGAVVQGVNTELNWATSRSFALRAGFTLQSSRYGEQQDFDEARFFRTPNTYGFLSTDWDITPQLCFTTSSTYTGSMLVPYFGEVEELRRSTDFFDLSLKLSYDIDLGPATLQFNTGVKNLFNAYQSDLEVGVNRDPGYVYGPGAPRTLYFGLSIGNL